LNALPAALAPLFAVAFAVGGAAVTWLEVVAVALSIAMVVCNIRVNVVEPGVIHTPIFDKLNDVTAQI